MEAGAMNVHNVLHNGTGMLNKNKLSTEAEKITKKERERETAFVKNEKTVRKS